ncbi:MAG TPA: TonB-dependent receptor [Steroidobacteraceae bacterium]|nr:TonB-dependent receptor [Steroidobacteraceae bacterium]
MSSSRSISRDIKRILYGSAVVAGLGGPIVGHAQTAAGGTVEEVVVTGIRYSLQQSIDTKRNADGVVDALTAEDVGKFPDKNLAEALQRVPGVTVNREFGEGERVNIRGTDARLTKTLLNGHSLSTADWFILDQLNTTRSFNYLLLPADIIGQTVVYKTTQADLEEGGVGGTVDIKTRNPLDLESMTIYGRLEGAYTDMAGDTDPNAGALFSWKNSSDTVGFLIAGIYQDRHIRRDGVETLGYFSVDADPGPAVNNVLVPSLIGSALFQQERKRTGGNFAFQFKPSDNLEFNLTGLYSKFDADNLNENYLAWGVRAIGNGGTLTNAVIDTSTASGTNTGTAVAGTISSLNNGTSDFGVVYDAIDRFAHSESRNIDLLTNFSPTEDWHLSFRLGYTDAEGDTDSQPFVEFGAPAVFNYDLRGKAPSVTYVPNGNGVAVDPTNPASMQFIFSSLHQILNNDDETYAYIDAEKDFDMGAFKGLKFGAKYYDHNRELIFNATTYGGFHVRINTTPATAFADGQTPGDFLENISSAGTLDQYWQVDKGSVEQILFNNLDVATAAGTGRTYYPQQNFSVNEKTYGGYVMGRFEGGGWRGNAGVRIVRTDQESNGNLITNDPNAIQNPFGNYIPISVDRSYTDYLPSLNMAYNMTDDIIMRFALGRVMTRPDFNDVAPRTSLNPGALTGTAGNPDLDPFRANQADLSMEWYPGAGRIFGAALFYKDIKSFITDKPVTQFFNVQSATSPNLQCTTVSPNVFNCPFLINQRSNGGGGRMEGFELQATQPIWGGFGLTGNYTFTDAEADNGDPLPGASRDTFNASAYFENPRVSARLSYTYRSEFFVTFDRSTHLNQDSLSSLDASLLVNIIDNLALTFDGINLTDEKIVQFADTKVNPRAIYDNGRTYYAGVRFKF